MFGGPIARTMATDALAFATTWQPHVIVHEDADLGSPLAAEKLGIPAVTVQASAWRTELTRAAALGVAALRQELDLPPDPDGLLQHRHLYLATRPASIRTFHEPYPATSHELRPVADDADGPDADATAEERPARPRIGVTFGTVAWDRVGIRFILDALAELPVEVVVALGRDPAALGPVPANARVEAYIPMSRLLPTCSVLIFHGGSGTMLAALASGVPLVIVPLGADQYDNAEACQAAGVATVLDADPLNPDAVVATAQAADTPDRRARSAEVAAEIAAMLGPEVALSTIEALVRA